MPLLLWACRWLALCPAGPRLAHSLALSAYCLLAPLALGATLVYCGTSPEVTMANTKARYPTRHADVNRCCLLAEWNQLFWGDPFMRGTIR